MNPESPENPPPATQEVIQPAKRRHVPYVLEGCGLLLLVGILGGVCLPFFGRIGFHGQQMRALEQARSIGLALKLFAGDNYGHYPAGGVPVEMTKTPTDANAAFACLFPSYTTSENIFGNRSSAYQTRPADDVIDNPAVFPPVKTLEPGENVYGYVMGLTDNSLPNIALVVDGTDGTGHYRTDPKSLGGVWKGERAIVIYLDMHGVVETLQGPPTARFIPIPGHPTQNLLDPASLGAGIRLLDPAIPVR